MEIIFYLYAGWMKNNFPSDRNNNIYFQYELSLIVFPDTLFIFLNGIYDIFLIYRKNIIV